MHVPVKGGCMWTVLVKLLLTVMATLECVHIVFYKLLLDTLFIIIFDYICLLNFNFEAR